MIVIQTNFFTAQWEYVGMIALSDRINVTVRARRSDTEDLIRGIRIKEGY